MEQISKKDIQSQLKLYKQILKNNIKTNKWLVKRIEQYKRRLEKLG